MRCYDWRELPFAEVWCVDTEFYPGPGYANGGRDGDPITPLALVAHEMRSGRTIRRWQGEFGPFPPYRLDGDSLIFTYFATAEFGFHLAVGWGEPAKTIDAYVEFRHATNDARLKSGDREKGFYSTGGALRHFGLDEIDVARKGDMRDRIIAGPPFSAGERNDILDYCEDDTRALARLIPRLIPTIRSVEHALFRGKYVWALSQVERRGVPIDLFMFDRINERWNDIKSDLVLSVDRNFGCYEFEGGQPHFREERFITYLRSQGIAWPTLDSGKPDLRSETFRMMAAARPQIAELHELRSTLAQLRNNKLAVACDGRNRTLLGPFGTKTGRNAPSNSKFVFGPAKCLRFLIAPPPGMALIHRDYSQQEMRIAAVVSGDAALLAACEEGDVYLGIAKRLGFLEDKPGLRDLFKTVVLGIQYGLGAVSLALRTNISLYEAGEILARLRATFRVFDQYCANVANRAGLLMAMTTPFGWTVRCPPGTNPRTIRNWPIQSAGAEILHVAVVLAERRGIRIVAPIHDALLAEGPATDIADVSAALDRVMRDASAIVLCGYELPTGDEPGPIMPGRRYFDKREEAMWNEINRLIEKTERRVA
jgi:hypothetical protein